MVNIQRVTKTRPRVESAVDPYALLRVQVNGKEMDARPIQFDSEPAGANTVLNHQGAPIRPVLASTLCPDCNAGLELDVTAPPPWAFTCPHCATAPAPVAGEEFVAARELPDPFRNPFLEGLLSPEEASADLVDLLANQPAPGSTVGQRRAGKAQEPATGLSQEELEA